MKMGSAFGFLPTIPRMISSKILATLGAARPAAVSFGSSHLFTTAWASHNETFPVNRMLTLFFTIDQTLHASIMISEGLLYIKGLILIRGMN